MSGTTHPLLRGGVTAPGAHDALSAVLARRAGFDAVYLSGFAFEATQIGAPDMAVSTMPELAAHAARIVAATDAPVICDIDTGFGGPNSVHRTIRAFERAGVAAVQIEDQAEPKRCPFLGGREVLPREQAAARVRIAAAARTGRDMLIIARTDADALSKDEVIERCIRYGEAGADLVLPMMRDLDGIPLHTRTPAERMALHREFAERIPYPVVALDPPPGYRPEDLFAVGIAMCVLPLASLEAAASALVGYYGALAAGEADEYFAAHPKQIPANLEMMRLLGLDAYLDREDQYFSSQTGASGTPAG